MSLKITNMSEISFSFLMGLLKVSTVLQIITEFHTIDISENAFFI